MRLDALFQMTEIRSCQGHAKFAVDNVGSVHAHAMDAELFFLLLMRY